MGDSLVVVNFKTYETAHGACAEDLAKAMESIDTGARIVACLLYTSPSPRDFG